MSKIDSLDVLEWTMEMRENNIMMDLHNREKLKRQREFEARKDMINKQKEKILDHEKCLKEKESEIKERSTILEVALKLIKEDERIAIQN